ncbi:MAG: hypothetical protein JWO59_2577 [Chloroflexi bacterium]|nr:hypothetical protein [Chloroflexota bacterium]
MNPITKSMTRLATFALAAGMLFSAVSIAHADAPGLTLGKDLVAAANGGKVAFATSDYGAGALPAGQVGWAPPSSNSWGGQRLIDGQASTSCGKACEWSSTTGTVPSPASPIDLIFTYNSKTPKAVNSVMIWQSQYNSSWTVQNFQVLVSTSTAPLATSQDYTALKSSFKVAGAFSATVLATEGQRFTFPPVQARYLMIRILSNGGSNSGVTLGEVAFFAAPQAPPPAAGGVPAPTLKFLSPTATAGSQEVALVVAGKNAAVGIVIDYPTGVQVVVGPKTAGADGHLVYTWTIPKGTTGKVVVTVVSAGKVKQGTISVS